MSRSAALAVVATSLQQRLEAQDQATEKAGGRVNHSVCKWCYSGISIDELCTAGKEFGLKSVECQLRIWYSISDHSG